MVYRHIVGAALLTWLTSGCAGTDVVGQWEGKIVPAATKDSVIEIEDEGGDATLEFPEVVYNDPELGEAYLPPITAKSEVDWSDKGDDEFDIELKCKSLSLEGASCSDTELSNFDLSCELKEDELSCKSSSPLLQNKVVLERQ